MAEKIVIEFEANTKALDTVIEKQVQIGKIDKDNAEQFKKSNSEYIDYAKKREVEVEKEIKNIERLRVLRKQSFNSEDIKFYNKEIQIAKSNIEALGGKYRSASAGASAFLKEQLALNSALKQSSVSLGTSTTSLSQMAGGATKAFGALRTLANIIPGIGISGLILAGYEILINLFEEFTGSIGENTVAMANNKKAIDDLIEARDSLTDRMLSAEDKIAIAMGVTTKLDIEKANLREKALKDLDALVAKEEELFKKLEEDGLKKGTAGYFAETSKIVSETYEQRRQIEDTLNKEIQSLDVLAYIESQKKKENVNRESKKVIKKDSEKAFLEEQKFAEQEARKMLSTVEEALKLSNERKVLLTEQGSEEELNVKIESILSERDFTIETTNLTEQERLNIIAESENKILELKKSFRDKDLEARMQEAENELKMLEEFEQEQGQIRLQARTEAEQGIINILDGINDVYTNDQIAAQKELLDNKTITEEEYEKGVKEIKKKAAQREKQITLFNIAIGTAESVIAALKIPPPAGEILAGVRAGVGITQAAIVAARPIPQFAKGTKSVEGGVKGKDSVLAMLMPDEMVIPVGTKQRYAPILNSIFDESISPNLLNNLALKKDIQINGASGVDEYVIKNGMKSALENGIYIKNMPKYEGMSYSELSLLKRRGVI